MSEVPLSLDQILNGQEARFVKEALIPRLSQMSEAGLIEPRELHLVTRQVKKSRSLPFGRIDTIKTTTRNTVAPDGSLYVLTYGFENTDLKFLVKESSKTEDVDAEIRNVSTMRERTLQRDSGITVPEIAFPSPAHRTVVYDFVEGVPFTTALQDPDQDPFQLFENLAKAYMGTFAGSDENVEPLGSLGDYLVQKPYLADHESALRKHLTDELDQARGDFLMHGDWHGMNIMTENRELFAGLDWPKMRSNGFPEFDFGLLIRKSNLTLDQQYKAVRAVAPHLARDGVSAQDSERLMHRFMFNADLVAYTSLKSGASTRKGRVIEPTMLEVYHALWDRLERSSDDVLPGALGDVLSQIEPRVATLPLDQSGYSRKEIKSMPIVAHGSYTVDMPEAPEYDAQEALDEIAKQATWVERRPRRLARNLGLLVFSLATIVGGAVEVANQRQQNDFQRDMIVALQQDRFYDMMETGVASAVHELIREIESPTRLPFDWQISYETLREIEREYDYPERFMLNLSDTFKYIGGFDSARNDYHPNIHVFDPWALKAAFNQPAVGSLSGTSMNRVSIEENARQAAEQIDKLRKQTGSLEFAVAAFLLPYRDGRWINGERAYEELYELPDQLTRWVGGVINGVGADYLGGANIEFLKGPYDVAAYSPDDIPVPHKPIGCRIEDNGGLYCPRGTYSHYSTETGEWVIEERTEEYPMRD